MTGNPIAKVQSAMGQSELLRTVRTLRSDGGLAFALGATAIRPLAADEIAQLERQGNFSDDWSLVRVADGFVARPIQRSTFQGRVVLGRFTGMVSLGEGVELPAGICNSTLVDCVVGHNCLIRDVKLLANYVVGEQAVLHDCGTIACERATMFGNGTELTLGIEGRGREVLAFAELDVKTAAVVARQRANAALQKDYAEAVAAYCLAAWSDRGVIGPGVVIRQTPTVKNAFLGAHTQVDAALRIADCTTLSTADEPVRIATGACVTRALLQWGSSVETYAVVERTVLAEHAHIEQHAKVTASLIGPNTGVAAGEVTASLLGPFVGFHHQALLIACYWPEGRGNVSYGANVGSNHTTKAPDQEFWPGEGAFLGLGVNIKYPTDFSQAPYTVVACGVTTMPQRVTFPFSLIASPSQVAAHIPPAFNEITPAWMLTNNLYAVKRTEEKHQRRNRARRTWFDFAIFRPEIIDLMRDACSRLEAVELVKDAYTEADIPGLGKNFMLEASRLSAIESYRACIAVYALQGLLRRVQEWTPPDQIPNLLQLATSDPVWEHQRRVLLHDLQLTDGLEGLRRLPGMLERMASAIERSKRRDDDRGVRIIDDYADVHVSAAKDPFVQQSWEEARRVRREVQALLESPPVEDQGSARPADKETRRPGATLLASLSGRPDSSLEGS